VDGDRARPRLADRLIAAAAGYLRGLELHDDELLVVADRDGRCIFAAGATREVVGLEPEALVGLDMFQGPDDGNRDPISAFIAGAIAQEGPIEPTTLRFTDAAGATRWIDVKAVNLLDDPDVRGVVFACRDVTLRRVAEDRSERLAQIVDSSNDAILLLDTDRRITSWNRGAERLLGWTADEVLGRVPDFLSPSGRMSTSLGYVERALEGASTEYQTSALRSSGEPVDVTLSLFPVRDATGAIVGAGGVLRDITPEVEALRELRARTGQQTAVAGLGERALAGTELAVLLADGARLVCDTLGCAAANVYEVPSGSDAAVLRATHGWGRGPVGTVVAVTPGSWLDHVRNDPDPLVSNDLAREHRYTVDSIVLGSGMRAAVTVRLDGRDGLVGAMSAMHDREREFTDDDVAFLQSTANVLAYAIDRGRITEEMRRRALHDVLTGLPNRTLLLDRLDHALGRAVAREDRIAVLFVDLDRFKRINDTMGHHAGDVVLMEVARRLRGAIRPGDTVARLGGDEFTIICEDVGDALQARAVASRVLECVAEPIALSGREVVVTASIGIAVGPDGDADSDGLLRDADLAMYRAKQTGRARAAMFDRSMRDEAADRLEVEEALRLAVPRGELSIAYQPIIALDSERVTGVEALLRWHHPEWGVVLPDEFIPIAEDAGLIATLGRWVLDTACTDTVALQVDEPGLKVAVNLSPRQLGEPEVVDWVREALERSGLDPASLLLEVTETALLDDLASIVDVLADLRAVGVQVAIDDFGTGYSSLSYLTELTVDEVKIDKSFTSGFGVDRSATAVVAGIIAMSRTLGLHTVAEGIETAAQRDGLLELGCDAGQGWLWTGPQELDKFRAWLAERGT
jgi:diguanylate cyclase (GGDEF)-like protein/PAS domain S-box-containing protein